MLEAVLMPWGAGNSPLFSDFRKGKTPVDLTQTILPGQSTGGLPCAEVLLI